MDVDAVLCRSASAGCFCNEINIIGECHVFQFYFLAFSLNVSDCPYGQAATKNRFKTFIKKTIARRVLKWLHILILFLASSSHPSVFGLYVGSAPKIGN